MVHSVQLSGRQHEAKPGSATVCRANIVFLLMVLTMCAVCFREESESCSRERGRRLQRSSSATVDCVYPPIQCASLDEIHSQVAQLAHH